MGRLTPGEFLIELDKLFAAQRDTGSVYVEQQAHKTVCLVRAYDGGKRKLSTELSAKEGQGKFAQQLQLMLRANMDGLRKRTRVRAPKAKP